MARARRGARLAGNRHAAMRNIGVIAADNAEKEALAVAVAMREALHQDKTAALVTPDRALGRRVLAALRRWNIEAEDSGGEALADTPAGIFARLAAQTALGGLAPVLLLALLKHPLLRFRYHPGVPLPHLSAPYCAARVHAPAARDLRTRSRPSAPKSKNSGATRNPICIRPIRESGRR